VALAGIGWVPFEPTDISNLGTTLPPPPSSGNADNAEQPQQLAAQLVSPIIVPQIDPGGVPGAGMHTDTNHPWLLVIVFVATVILVVPLLLVAEKQRRRWRRRHFGSPARRVVGAWHEVRDRLVERGLTKSSALTTYEVARRARQLNGAAAANDYIDHIDRLASLVSVALFAPAAPAEGDAREAWELARFAGRALKREGRLGRRAIAAVDPRPLLRWRS
jgi:hypothetical protein